MSSGSIEISRSIIIPNYNNADRLSQCLQVVKGQADNKTEIIVVDNQSTDDSRDIARSFGINLYIQKKYQSPYACRDLGIQRARGEIIILLDSNGIPMKGWLANGCEALEEGTGDVLSGQLIPEYQYEPPGILERFDYLHSIIPKGHIQALPAGNLFFYKSLYLKSGGFDPSNRSLEDTRWTSRLAGHGYHLAVCSSARYTYPMKSGTAFRNKYMRLGRGRKEGMDDSRKILLHYLFKNLLPPNPDFYSRINELNRTEQTRLGRLTIYLICWYIKLLYAWGALSKNGLER